MTELLTRSSMVALLGLAVSVAVAGAALAYAIQPTERRLALMRPLSLAAIFGGLSTFTMGLASIFRAIGVSRPFTDDTWRGVAMGAAEAVAGLFFAFACLTVAWLLVALGLRRA